MQIGLTQSADVFAVRVVQGSTRAAFGTPRPPQAACCFSTLRTPRDRLRSVCCSSSSGKALPAQHRKAADVYLHDRHGV